jgi:hypothetical protein
VNDIVTAAMMNANVRDAVNFLLNLPLFTGSQAAAQSIPNGGAGNTALTLDTNVVDTYAGHSTTVNNTRYVSQAAGYYDVVGVAGFAANATGVRIAAISKNGSQLSPDFRGPAVATFATRIPVVLPTVLLNVGDYVELTVYQTSGGALSTDGSCTLNARWVHA